MATWVQLPIENFLRKKEDSTEKAENGPKTVNDSGMKSADSRVTPTFAEIGDPSQKVDEISSKKDQKKAAKPRKRSTQPRKKQTQPRKRAAKPRQKSSKPRQKATKRRQKVVDKLACHTALRRSEDSDPEAVNRWTCSLDKDQMVNGIFQSGPLSL